MNPLLAALIFGFLAAPQTQAVGSNKDFKCYFCESMKTDVKDKYDTCKEFSPDITQVECSRLDYGDALSRADGVPLNPQLASVFKRETFSLDSNTTYKCITTTLRKDNRDNFIRTCAPLKPNVHSVCDFIKAEIVEFEVRDCTECSSDLCNAALLPTSSISIQLAVILIVWLICKL